MHAGAGTGDTSFRGPLLVLRGVRCENAGTVGVDGDSYLWRCDPCATLTREEINTDARIAEIILSSEIEGPLLRDWGGAALS